MAQEYEFSQIGRLPMPGDNVAIISRRLNIGDTIRHAGGSFRLSHTVLEGHRFALEHITEGDPLLSWGLPFGHALRPIAPGEYLCNAKILHTLQHRAIDFDLPTAPNFKDYMQRFELQAKHFKPADQVPRHTQPRTFQGYARSGGRGVGTRNYIVLLGTSSLAGSFVRALEQRFQAQLSNYPNLDGVVAVAHTEGGGQNTPNNQDRLLQALAGFMVHPNCGAVLAVDAGSESINNALLREFMLSHDYPLAHIPHSFMSLERDFHSMLEAASRQIERWLLEVNAMPRSEQAVEHLKLALQCGGSDAFSGISGNALAGWVAKETIKHGGSANLAETDELIGAEPYVLDKVRDLATAQAFLDKIETFKERARWHGHSAEGNPSGGNQFRGLYNIALKSIGAARKKDPEVRLDYVLDYAEPMRQSGYYFMDSPGNDLESIAGQVASGSNLILFITGNGSITNFPFVPTLKFVTTSGRWQMLANEMDVNAGRYQDGMPMDELGLETFELALKVASGQRSLGERAGHAQVSIWRDWRQTEAGHVEAILQAPKPSGQALAVRPSTPPPAHFKAVRNPQGYATDRIGLVVPTSLCSGQIARMLAEKLNRQSNAKDKVSRFVALVHTEGCGAAPGYSQQLYLRTVLGHIRHPMVIKGLLLEHGCEQTHNDAMRNYLSESGLDINRLGWASVQLDGGIVNVMDKVTQWFAEQLATEPATRTESAGLAHLRLGLSANGELSDMIAQGFAQLAQDIVNAGGLVVIPANADLLQSTAFRQTLLLKPDAIHPSLAYGQGASSQGLHIMETPTEHDVETLTGLGASGVEIILSHQQGLLLQAHPMIPVLQASADLDTRQRLGKDLDIELDIHSAPVTIAEQLLSKVLAVASREYMPTMLAQGNTDFQLTRGLLGLSL